MTEQLKPGSGPLRTYLFRVIFEADTRTGKFFDVMLILSIAVSVAVVMLESVSTIRDTYGHILTMAEWIFTAGFTVEYLLRLFCVARPGRYAVSFFGVVDLLAVLPTYLGLILPGTHFLATVRILRVLRIFRVLKLMQYVGQMELILTALRLSRNKIIVFLFTVGTLVMILGSIMYVVEGGENGFTSIPRSVYWAVVTLTTVGYGDISPGTDLGRTIAAIVMILGYSIIAVPTGIVSVGFAEVSRKMRNRARIYCSACGETTHDTDAVFCKTCGAPLEPPSNVA